MKKQKTYLWKVYSSTGTFLATWNDVIDDPDFHTVINGGLVECDVKLARQTINFGETLDVALGNEVQLWCYDDDDSIGFPEQATFDDLGIMFDDPTCSFDGEIISGSLNAGKGTKIMSGYISRYDPVNDGPTEYVQVYILGWHTRMASFLLEDSVGATGLTYTAIDPGKIAEDIINKGMSEGLPISWSNNTLQKTGTVASYTFQANTIQECIDQVLALSPANWYWYVDKDKKLNLHPKNGFAKHTFTIGKEIFYIEPQKNVENIVNRVYFVGGTPAGASQPLYTKYERQPSIQNYGVYGYKYSNSGVLDQPTMDAMAKRILDMQQEIEVRTIIRVKDDGFDRDNGYNIESIKIGDTCQVRNYQDAFANSKWDVMSWDTDYWDYNVRNLTEIIMQIVEIEYTPNYVELTISSKIENVSQRVQDLANLILATQSASAPNNPSVGTV